MGAVGRLPLLAALACLAAAGPVAADDIVRLQPGMGGVADIGATRCDYYSYVHPAGPSGFHQAVLYYFEGFVRARTGQTVNAWLAGVPGGQRWTFAAIGDHVLAWCEAHPEGTVADGVGDLWRTAGGTP
jgi:hypothetical protein